MLSKDERIKQSLWKGQRLTNLSKEELMEAVYTLGTNNTNQPTTIMPHEINITTLDIDFKALADQYYDEENPSLPEYIAYLNALACIKQELEQQH